MHNYPYGAAKRRQRISKTNLDHHHAGTLAARARLISKVSYIGRIAEVDRIVRISRYQFANEIANLQLMPAVRLDRLELLC